MRHKQSVLAVAISIIGLSYGQKASAQQIDARCKQFHALLGQESISMSTYTQDDIQIVGQALEPIVSIRNASARSLEVPDISKASGVYVDTSHPGVNYRSVNHQRWKDIDFCSFEKIVLAAGETREFFLTVDKSSFTDVDARVQSAWVPFASKEPGKHRYLVDLGRDWINGEYTSSEVEVEDYACFAKRAALRSELPKSTLEDQLQFCQIAVIAKLGSARFLLTGTVATDLKKLAMLQRELSRTHDKQKRDLFLASLAPIRFLALDESVRFSGAKIQDLTPIEKVGLLTAGGRTIQLQEVKERQAEQAYARSHRK